MLFQTILEWIQKEKELGIEQPDNAVLSTITLEGKPRSRVVVIRTIDAMTESLVFFTQRGTRKVAELLNNPQVAFNFYFIKQQKQIILEGTVKPLSFEENQSFWETLPRERQLRFSAYAPTSGQPIDSIHQLEEAKQVLIEKFQDKPIPMSDSYCGFRFTPETVLFYTLGKESFSEIIRHIKTESGWTSQLISP
jgi:pyridoxamine 5'-phosphate oxidase